MPAQSGHLSFAATAKDAQWDVPVATIGGLPIAVIDRKRSADLMIDTALAQRGSSKQPLIFTSANGQVLSLCAREPKLRELFLAADLIHADLINKRFAYVAVSRGSHDAHIYTDNAASLVGKLSHDVVKSSALQAVQQFSTDQSTGFQM